MYSGKEVSRGGVARKVPLLLERGKVEIWEPRVSV